MPAPSAWRLRWMSRRWGSCSSRQQIIFNPALMAFALETIDYVIAHELCHLVHLNHSPSYYRLLSQVMPDWRPRRQQLNDHAHLVI